jgi:catalase
MEVPKGRVAYEPNSLDNGGPRENPTLGFKSYPEEMTEEKTRRRIQTFADHYSQARLFFHSMSEPEQRHIVSALAFELGKVETVSVRTRILGHLANIDRSLLDQVQTALRMPGQADKITPAIAPQDLNVSPTLSLIKKAVPTLGGRKLGVLVADGFDGELLVALQAALKKEKAALAVITPKIGGAKNSAGKLIPGDMALSAAPSSFFEAVIVLTSEASATLLAKEAAAIDWLRDAYGHLKVIAYHESAQSLVKEAGIKPDEGVIKGNARPLIDAFVKQAKGGKIWKREPLLRSPG